MTLENGELFELSIPCALAPQEPAGSEIQFAVVSDDDPLNLDVTQFGAKASAAQPSIFMGAATRQIPACGTSSSRSSGRRGKQSS